VARIWGGARIVEREAQQGIAADPLADESGVLQVAANIIADADREDQRRRATGTSLSTAQSGLWDERAPRHPIACPSVGHLFHFVHFVLDSVSSNFMNRCQAAVDMPSVCSELGTVGRSQWAGGVVGGVSEEGPWRAIGCVIRGPKIPD